MKTGIAFFFSALVLFGQQTKPVLTANEKVLYYQIGRLRSVPDQDRPAVTHRLALRIRELPKTPGKELLAIQLANLVTEGEPGPNTLQGVAATLAAALSEQPASSDDPYFTLAQLVRYEHVVVSLDAPQFREAMAKLAADDDRRQHLDFTLEDLDGKRWDLRELTGKVVLVNFWATWCPPCRKEMPDLDAIYKEYRDKGLVILAISDEDRDKVTPFPGRASGELSDPARPGPKGERRVHCARHSEVVRVRPRGPSCGGVDRHAYASSVPRNAASRGALIETSTLAYDMYSAVRAIALTLLLAFAASSNTPPHPREGSGCRDDVPDAGPIPAISPANSNTG